LKPVRITVKQGKCQDDIHQIGQVFIVKDTTPEGICKDAWNAIAPYVMTLQCGGNFTWAEEKGTATIHCPDPKGITLELRLIEK
jgi:uncharacterized repeat protein (TIGR04076 family)